MFDLIITDTCIMLALSKDHRSWMGAGTSSEY